MKKIVVTWGLGFIGSYFVEKALKEGFHIINIDKNIYKKRTNTTYAMNKKYQLWENDILDIKEIPSDVDFVVHFAAETSVDESINSPEKFIDSNINWTLHLLQLFIQHVSLEKAKFIYISTDEVYWEIPVGMFNEESPMIAWNTYAATKIAAEQLVFAFHKTYWIRFNICRSSNIYWYWQSDDKLIPKVIKFAWKKQKIWVHGSWLYSREWTFAWDNVEWIFIVMIKGSENEIYNISTNEEFTNLEIIKKVLKITWLPENFYVNVENRKWQDCRYSVESKKIRLLWWRQTMTVDRYLDLYFNKSSKGESWIL